MKCPICGSEDLRTISETSTTGKDYSFGKGCCGYVLLGNIGILCGLCGEGKRTSTKSYWVCGTCGHKFRI